MRSGLFKKIKLSLLRFLEAILCRHTKSINLWLDIEGTDLLGRLTKANKFALNIIILINLIGKLINLYETLLPEEMNAVLHRVGVENWKGTFLHELEEKS